MNHEHLESFYPDTSRFGEIEKILTYVKEGNSCQIVGMPGVGRGHVCKFLAYNRNIRIKHLGDAQTSYHFVFVNIAEVKNRQLFDVLKCIFLELISSLHERQLHEVFAIADSIFKDTLSYQDELVLFQGLKKTIDFLTHEKNLTIVLFLERFETYIPKLTDDFFVHLRSLRDTAKYKFSVVFSVTRPLEESVESAIFADFYEFFAGKTVYLSLYDKPGIVFRIAYLEQITHKKLNKKTIDAILTITGGHGKLTRLAVESLLSKTPTRIKGEDISTYLLQEKSIQSTLYEIWNYLTPSEQEFILFSLTRDTHIPQYTLLEKIGLISNTKITIPLFEIFLQTIKTHYHTKLHLTYDPLSNTIKKGTLTISEQLTAAEFRFLRFLLENPGKVIDRDEIIHAVWKDTATTEGVTDQALDQLIFRLRKKIEPNPTHPIFMQTIKGRGIIYNDYPK
jgi:DNA-binding winged helix-turn-helix (wHTH) protein